jgi:hypothetical protein
MFKWETMSDYETRQMDAISLILSNHVKLLEFLFKQEKAELRYSPEKLIKLSGAFSSGEKVLVRVALDFWSGSGNARVWELMEKLDPRSFENVLLGLQYLGGNARCAGTPSRRRLKLDSFEAVAN